MGIVLNIAENEKFMQNFGQKTRREETICQDINKTSAKEIMKVCNEKDRYL
jgi:hypothetical protein